MSVLDTFSLKGKVALITGGAGIAGQQMVRALAEAGAQTIVASRNMDLLNELQNSLAADGLTITIKQYDQAEETSCLSLHKTIIEEFDHIDILVNNSVARPMKQGFQSSADAFAHSMQVNATGLFIITRAVGDAMAKRGSGSIINIGSIQGMIGPDPNIYRGTEMHGWAPDYFFHKGGVINFTRFIASYYGDKGIRCNCISPGGVQTDDHPETFVRQYSERTFLNRMIGDTELKGAVVFLASDASTYITGTNIPVDGGYTAK